MSVLIDDGAKIIADESASIEIYGSLFAGNQTVFTYIYDLPNTQGLLRDAPHPVGGGDNWWRGLTVEGGGFVELRNADILYARNFAVGESIKVKQGGTLNIFGGSITRKLTVTPVLSFDSANGQLSACRINGGFIGIKITGEIDGIIIDNCLFGSGVRTPILYP